MQQRRLIGGVAIWVELGILVGILIKNHKHRPGFIYALDDAQLQFFLYEG